MSSLTVECDECGSSGEKDFPPVNLFGSTVVFTDLTDPTSQFIISGEDTICYHCKVEES